MKRCVALIVTILSVSLAWGLAAYGSGEQLEPMAHENDAVRGSSIGSITGQFVITDFSSASGQEAGGQLMSGAIHLPQMSVQSIADLTEKVPTDRDLVVSFDNPEIADAVIKSRENSNGLTRLIPFGSKLSAKFRLAQDHLIESAANDKIGLMVVAINTAYDSYLWMHAYQYSEGVRAAQAIYTTMIAVAFSIDKDLWAKTARKIQGKILNLYDPTVMNGDEIMSLRTRLATSFAANYLLGMVVQSGRLAILSFDKVMDAPTLLSAFGSSVALGTALTVANFGWSEFGANIDQKKGPFAKWVVRRFAELRSITIGQLAPSGKLLQPEVYGASPWIVLGVTGLAGVTAFINSHRIARWLETSKYTHWSRRVHRSMQDAFSAFATSFRHSDKVNLNFEHDLPAHKASKAIPRCEALFAN